MLNRAHRLHRQAEKATRKGRIEEAIQFHKEATETLRDLLVTIEDDKVAESLRLQTQLHERERIVLGQQKRQKAQKDLERLKVKMSSQGASSSAPPNADSSSLQTSIHRKFMETETLLGRLGIQNVDGDDEERRGSAEIASSCKKPKDDKTIIEELQTANSHLRQMVDSLFFELTNCQKDNIRLRDRIRDLENGNEGGSEESIRHIDPKDELPPLPPLDLPAFDFGAAPPPPPTDGRKSPSRFEPES